MTLKIKLVVARKTVATKFFGNRLNSFSARKIIGLLLTLTADGDRPIPSATSHRSAS
jgi:hypothetical protein